MINRIINAITSSWLVRELADGALCVFVFVCLIIFGIFSFRFVFAEEQRLDIDLSTIGNTTAERKVDSRNLKMEVYPTPRNVTNETKHMSPPNLTHKLYCINGYLYVMVFVNFGWDSNTGKAERVETHFMQQFDKYGKGIVCR